MLPVIGKECKQLSSFIRYYLATSHLWNLSFILLPVCLFFGNTMCIYSVRRRSRLRTWHEIKNVAQGHTQCIRTSNFFVSLQYISGICG